MAWASQDQPSICLLARRDVSGETQASPDAAGETQASPDADALGRRHSSGAAVQTLPEVARADQLQDRGLRPDAGANKVATGAFWSWQDWRLTRVVAERVCM